MAQEFDGLTYQLVDMFERDDHNQAEVFHESTKLTRATEGTLSERVSLVTRDPNLQRMMWTAWKAYEGSEKIPMPTPSLGAMTLEEAFRRRRSQIGSFTGASVTFEQLASVLRFAYGPTLAVTSQKFLGEGFFLRATPSGGGLYPLEIYPLVFNVEGLAPGIYHYSPSDHSLEVLRRGDPREDFLKCTTYVDLGRTCAALFVITAVMPRTMSKYLFRGYRFLSYDVGALLQSLYLGATALDLGTVALGGFYDNMLGEVIGVDNVAENVMMTFMIGQRTPIWPAAREVREV